MAVSYELVRRASYTLKMEAPESYELLVSIKEQTSPNTLTLMSKTPFAIQLNTNNNILCVGGGALIFGAGRNWYCVEL
jgi:hypothetical protein